MDLVPWKFGRQSAVLDSLRDEFNQLFDRFWTGELEPMAIGRWMPAIDVSETDSEVVVQAEVPGLEAKEIEISIEGGMLTIKGEKKEEREQKGRDYHRVERRYGTFVRSVQLPAEVVADKAEARYDSGILTVKLPKTAQAKPKQVAVRAE